MLGKWLCTKRNPSGIHKAISEVRQSWNVGVLHVNRSRATTSSERTSQPRREDDCTWFTQKWTVPPALLAGLKVLSQHGTTTALVVVQLQRWLHHSGGAVWESTEIWERSRNWKSLTQVRREVFGKKDNIKWVLSIKSQGTLFTFPLQGQTLGRCFK